MKLKSIPMVVISSFIVGSGVVAGEVFSYTPYDTEENTRYISERNVYKQNSDAIEIILKDHAHIRTLIGRLNKSLDSSDIEQSKKIFSELNDFLIHHELMEQTIWYPELEKKDPKLKEITSELKDEEMHANKEMAKIAAIKMIKKINPLNDDYSDWAKKVRCFTKEVEKHANDEETRLFPKAEAILNKLEKEEIGNKLLQFKEKHSIKN